MYDVSRLWTTASFLGRSTINSCPYPKQKSHKITQAHYPSRGEKPDVSHLRVFGSTAYAHLPKNEQHKLDPKARKCLLLGYGIQTKGHRLYDLARMRVVLSRDVIFNELEVRAQKETERC